MPSNSSQSGDLIKVGDLLNSGVDELDVACDGCKRSWISPISHLPLDTTLAHIRAAMRCDACDFPALDIMPAWPS